MTENLWQFLYHRGPAPLSAVCQASSDVKAMEVATAWCRKNNFRPPASVRPFIVADESILREASGPEPLPIPDAVGATTGVHVGKSGK